MRLTRAKQMTRWQFRVRHLALMFCALAVLFSLLWERQRNVERFIERTLNRLEVVITDNEARIIARESRRLRCQRRLCAEVFQQTQAEGCQQTSAAKLLQAMPSDIVTESVFSRLSDRESHNSFAVNLLLRVDKLDLEMLVDLLNSDSLQKRITAAQLLGIAAERNQLNDYHWSSLGERVRKDASAEVRLLCVLAFFSAPESRIVKDILSSATADRNAEVRKSAKKAIESLTNQTQTGIDVKSTADDQVDIDRRAR